MQMWVLNFGPSAFQWTPTLMLVASLVAIQKWQGNLTFWFHKPRQALHVHQLNSKTVQWSHV